MVISEPGTISAAAVRNAAELGSPGTLTVRPSSSASPATVMAREPSLRSATVTSAPKWRSMRSVWSRVASRLDDGRGAGRMQPGEQHGRLDLRRGDRQAILDRQQVGRAAKGQRQRVLAVLLDLQPHLLQRLEHAAHGPARQRGIAHEPGTAYRGRRPRPSSAAGRCRNCRSRCRRSGSARPPTPRPSTSQVAPTLRTGQPSACSALAVLSTSSPSSRPAMRVRPVASAPNISARCEIDLSPGTRTRPEAPATWPRPAARGVRATRGASLASIGAGRPRCGGDAAPP